MTAPVYLPGTCGTVAVLFPNGDSAAMTTGQARTLQRIHEANRDRLGLALTLPPRVQARVVEALIDAEVLVRRDEGTYFRPDLLKSKEA